MNADTLYWLFSTVAQTYGAIIGVMGMLVIFRLQNFSTLRGSIITSLKEPMLSIFGREALGIQSKDIIKSWTEYPDAKKTQMQKHSRDYHTIMNNQVKRLRENLEWSAQIRSRFYFFMAYHLAFIVVSILLLFATDELQTYYFYWVFWCLIVAVTVSLLSMGTLAQALFKERE